MKMWLNVFLLLLSYVGFSTTSLARVGESSAFEQTPFGVVKSTDIIQVNHDQKVVLTPDEKLLVVDKKTNQTVKVYDCAGRAPALSLNARIPAGYAQSGTGYWAVKTLHDSYEIKRFSTQWEVPQPPQNQLTADPDYLWNGLQGGYQASQISFAQPVMSWYSPKKSYRIANWGYVHGRLIHGEEELVKPGTKLHGLVEFVRVNPRTLRYEYVSKFVGHPKLDLDTDGHIKPNMLEEVFEPYPPVKPSEFPASPSGLMHDIKLITMPAYPKSQLDWEISGVAPALSVPLPSGKPNTEIISPSAQNGKIKFNWH
ncbi:hypothetical protein [Candidatus Sororendozoicomonas aggregata]|uniref:hypothetical protein n=1 Tax=Candidatus Sororendozoicomonas aggregata TaxID=3073239 RepID=UPI002ED152D9